MERNWYMYTSIHVVNPLKRVDLECFKMNKFKSLIDNRFYFEKDSCLTEEKNDCWLQCHIFNICIHNLYTMGWNASM